jgi:hypothetical protein
MPPLQRKKSEQNETPDKIIGPLCSQHDDSEAADYLAME